MKLQKLGSFLLSIIRKKMFYLNCTKTFATLLSLCLTFGFHLRQFISSFIWCYSHAATLFQLTLKHILHLFKRSFSSCLNLLLQMNFPFVQGVRPGLPTQNKTNWSPLQPSSSFTTWAHRLFIPTQVRYSFSMVLVCRPTWVGWGFTLGRSPV